MQHNLQHMTMRGPKPLPLHLNMAAAAYIAETQTDDDRWQAYKNMLAGIQRYHAHKASPATRHLTAVASQSGSTIYAHPETDQARDGLQTPLLLIPSMINGAGIFDILPDCSLMAFFNRCGLPTYLLDWGDAVQDAGMQDISAIAKRLNALAVELAEQHNVRSIHGLGYCMGGHFLAAGTTLAPQLYKSLTFLSTPWDFAASGYDLARLIRKLSPAICSHLSISDYLSPQWLHTIFALLEPGQVLHKFARFASMSENSYETERFVAVEDWLNSTQGLPHELAWQMVTRIVQHNALMRGTFQCDEMPVDAGAMYQPAHIIAPQHDKLATPESVEALYRQMPNAALYTPECGHIAPLCDTALQERLWPAICDKLTTMNRRDIPA